MGDALKESFTIVQTISTGDINQIKEAINHHNSNSIYAEYSVLMNLLYYADRFTLDDLLDLVRYIIGKGCDINYRRMLISQYSIKCDCALDMALELDIRIMVQLLFYGAVVNERILKIAKRTCPDRIDILINYQKYLLYNLINKSYYDGDTINGVLSNLPYYLRLCVLSCMVKN